MSSRPHEVSNSGMCTTCNSAASEKQILECCVCKTKYHADCNNTTAFCTKTFLKSFKGLQGGNFTWTCNHCKTDHENNEASSLKEQMSFVVAAVADLTKEVSALKSEKHATHHEQQPSQIMSSSNTLDNHKKTYH